MEQAAPGGYNDAMERRRITFSGRVQGVGFRATSRIIALGHPVTGWVRNEPDGTVLMEVQGAGEGIDAFLDALRWRMEGLIQNEEAVGIPVVEGEKSFEIRR